MKTKTIVSEPERTAPAVSAHVKASELLANELNSDLKRGMSAEAVSRASESYGKNKLNEAKHKSAIRKFAEQFKDVMVIMLIIAAVVSFVMAFTGAHIDVKEFFEPLLILLIVIANAVMGVLQENKAEKALDALKNLSAPRAKVVRAGTESVIDAEELVPGDIILLEAGDVVPADARLIVSSSLKAEESRKRIARRTRRRTRRLATVRIWCSRGAA